MGYAPSYSAADQRQKPCPWCQSDMKADICGKVIPVNAGWSMVCTREVGHNGDHVACGTSHDVARLGYGAPVARRQKGDTA